MAPFTAGRRARAAKRRPHGPYVELQIPAPTGMRGRRGIYRFVINLGFLFPLHVTGLGVGATVQVVQRGGSFGQPGWSPARTLARWQPLSPIRITCSRFFDPNRRFWQLLGGRWQSVTLIDRYSDHTA